MKKFLTLTLVLVMALSLAAPALAYTNNAALQQGVSPYTVDIYLVEFSSGDWLSSWLSMPPSDRGYAKNEVIAAIGALTVPKGYDAFDDNYRQLRFKPTNVTLNVTENMPATLGSYSLTHSVPNNGAVVWSPIWSYSTSNGRLDYRLGAFVANTSTNSIPVNTSDTKTYRWLVFGKVTDDDAKLSFILSRAAGFATIDTTSQWWTVTAVWPTVTVPTQFLVLNEDHVVYRLNQTSTGENEYWIFENSIEGFDFASSSTPGDLQFRIETGARGKTLRLYMYPNDVAGTEYRIHVEPSTQELVFIITQRPTGSAKVNDQIKFGTAGYNSLLAFYKDYFEDKLGFTAYNEGNLMNESDWTAIAGAAWDISETVDIEPWTPYVSVPDNIVTDPPKTGDVSFLGFVLIALAGAAAVVVRKVRA